jgi:chloramphenicol-sensitive protein RarD
MLPAHGYLIWLQVDGTAHFTGYGAGHIAVMVAAGVVTAVPLLMFGAAARVIPLSVLGFLQYINPLTVFLLGVTWAGESMSPSRWAGFAVIWVALALLSVEALRRSRRPRQIVVAAGRASQRPSPSGAERSVDRTSTAPRT